MTDPDGHPRTIPVVVNDDLIVWHSAVEFERLWAGVHRQVCVDAVSDLDSVSYARYGGVDRTSRSLESPDFPQ